MTSAWFRFNRVKTTRGSLVSELAGKSTSDRKGVGVGAGGTRALRRKIIRGYFRS